MANIRVKLKDRGMDELLHSHGVRSELMRLAKQVESAAKASAPVKTGTYAASIRAETVDHPTRVIGRVVADVDYALVVEANTGNLARALDAAG